MIKKSGILVVVSVGLIILSLSGCQTILNKIPFLKSTSVPEPQVNYTTEPTVPPENKPVLPPSQGQENQLVIWLPPQFDPNNGTQAGELLKSQLDQYVKDHPGVTISVRIKSGAGPGGLLDSLTTASTAAPSVLPGIVILSRSDLETAADDGLLNPVDPSDININESNLFAFAINMAQTGEARYGIPFSGDALVLAYKPVQIGYPPVYWRDILQKQSILAFPVADPKGQIPLLLYQEFGGEFLGDGEDIMLQEIPLQRSLQVFSDGAEANVFPYWLTEYTSFEQSWQALQDSHATYAIIWVSQYLSQSQNNMSVIGLPSVDKNSMTLADGWVLAFPQTSPERYLAHLALAEYLIDPEFQKKWSEAAGVLPVSRTALS
jgi:ABC-type glycerol-3-phosphate transport system substrate-binding protein